MCGVQKIPSSWRMGALQRRGHHVPIDSESKTEKTVQRGENSCRPGDSSVSRTLLGGLLHSQPHTECM
eukprot:17040-Eustigmatos_ZCMA.PRE.1